MAETTDTLIHPRVLPHVDDAPPVAWAGVPVGSGGRPARIEFTLYGDLASAERDWRAFEQTADCTPFQTFDWLAAWDRHIGVPSGVRPAIVIGRRGDKTVFLFPFAVEPGFVRRLVFLGHGLCDYNAPLLAPGFADVLGEEGFRSLWEQVRKRLQAVPYLAHDAIEFTKMPAAVGAQDNPFARLDVMLHPSGAYQANLGGDWETFYSAKRSSTTRRRDRTKLKKLAELGEVRFVTPEASETAATLDTLIQQKSRAFAHMGVPDIFARPGHIAFFHEIARARQFVHISRLDVGATRAAVNLGLTFRDCYYHILASYDDGETSRFGPGAAHLRDLLRYATEHGMSRFDFTIGDEPYKRDWCDTEQALYDHVGAASWRGLPFAALSAARRRIKREIKRNASLWAMVVRARETMGRLRKREE